MFIGVSVVLKSPIINCVTVKFPFNSYYHLPYVLRCFYVGCLYIYNYCIFFLDWSLDHYVVSFVSYNGLYFKVYFIWVLLLLLSFGIYMHEISFSSPSLSVCMCPLFWGGSLVDNICRGLVFVSIQPVFVFWLRHSTHLHLR